MKRRDRTSLELCLTSAKLGGFRGHRGTEDERRPGILIVMTRLRLPLPGGLNRIAGLIEFGTERLFIGIGDWEKAMGENGQVLEFRSLSWV